MTTVTITVNEKGEIKIESSTDYFQTLGIITHAKETVLNNQRNERTSHTTQSKNPAEHNSAADHLENLV